MIATYENIYLTDTSESVINAEIEQSVDYVQGTLRLDLTAGSADFTNSVYPLHFECVSITVFNDGDNVSVELVEPDETEWIFEKLAGGV